MQGLKYTVDIVFCIDATGSMGHLIDEVKSGTLKFHEDLTKLMNEKDKQIDTLRVKVISYRDFYSDGDDAFKESDFFTLPDQKDELSAFVSVIRADGGGDEPENGLEALAVAFQSKWNKEGDRRRQIVVISTDASAHPLEKNESSKPSNYPENMPKNLDEFSDFWEGQSYLSNSSKRLLIYAPDAYPWTEIGNHFSNTIHFPSKAGNGLADTEYSEILNAIANSV
jgi:hypothetical protein